MSHDKKETALLKGTRENHKARLPNKDSRHDLEFLKGSKCKQKEAIKGKSKD